MTERIRILSEDLANRIAAGEVIERPASVVKELAENALDAEARAITVTVQAAGRRLIRVSDDGYGMSRDDALLAFERHATSKIRAVEDLGCITTLGFRGEALPSIASVSRLTLTTCAQLGETGTWLELDGGVIRQVREWTGPVGTSIEVRQLFFNTPARLKFLKSRHTELGHMVNVVSQLALAHPGIRFRFTHEQQELLELPPAVTTLDRLATIWGAEIGRQLIPIEDHEGSVLLSGFVSPATWSRASRDAQYLFVNGRAVRDRLLLHALSEAYRHILPEKRHPMVFVFLALPPQDVDVNVHPHKTEVRFAQPDLVHAVVREAVQRGLSRTTVNIPSVSGMDDSRPSSLGAPSLPLARPDWAMAHTESLPRLIPGIVSPQPLPSTGFLPPQTALTRPEHYPLQASALVPTHQLRPLGQVHHSFIVADGPDGLYLFDQHALQERILYEVLKAGFDAEAVPRQHLLFPTPIELTPAAMVWFEEFRALLERIGFEAEPFGGATVVLRTVPAVLAEYPYLEIYRDTFAALAATGRASPYDEIVEAMLASLACHDAIKINRPLDLSEMRRLLDDFARVGAPATCPHGRPLALTIPVSELRRRFHRS
ncbi:MAG TPA: DNA mismatch repair endonuclease MutL [Candidatus Tectomicrobia bacterium]|nr:DNA mismatch repair endonuclease MutL [Candidatus Tectomicrobia bacterium]